MHSSQPAWLNEEMLRAKDSAASGSMQYLCDIISTRRFLGVCEIHSPRPAPATSTALGKARATRWRFAEGDRTFRILKPDGSTLYNNINQLRRIGVLTLDSTTTYTIIWDPCFDYTDSMTVTIAERSP